MNIGKEGEPMAESYVWKLDAKIRKLLGDLEIARDEIQEARVPGDHVRTRNLERLATCLDQAVRAAAWYTSSDAQAAGKYAGELSNAPRP